jgi:hypothetical protein
LHHLKTAHIMKILLNFFIGIFQYSSISINILKKTLLFLILISIYEIHSASAQNHEEHIDSTIVKIVNPEKDIKLWYGTDEFAISDFVVLPKYTLLYSQSSAILRLLNNENKLAVDEISLKSINGIISPISFHDKKGHRYPLYLTGSGQGWFTINNDSTIFAGTIRLKSTENNNGYLKINISNNKMSIDKVSFVLPDSTFKFHKTLGNFWASSYSDFNGYKLYIIPEMYKPSNNNSPRECLSTGRVILKDKNDIISTLYESPLDNSRIAMPINLFQYQGFNYLSDPSNEIKRYNLHGLPISTLKQHQYGRAFFVDNVTKKLFYRVKYVTEKATLFSIYRVSFKDNVIDFTLEKEDYLKEYYSRYINNNFVYLLNLTNNFIYTYEIK